MKEIKLTDILVDIDSNAPIPFYVKENQVEIYCPFCGQTVFEESIQKLQVIKNIVFEGQKSMVKHLSKSENESCNMYESKVIFDFKVKYSKELFEDFGMKFKKD